MCVRVFACGNDMGFDQCLRTEIGAGQRTGNIRIERFRIVIDASRTHAGSFRPVATPASLEHPGRECGFVRCGCQIPELAARPHGLRRCPGLRVLLNAKTCEVTQ